MDSPIDKYEKRMFSYWKVKLCEIDDNCVNSEVSTCVKN